MTRFLHLENYNNNNEVNDYEVRKISVLSGSQRCWEHHEVIHVEISKDPVDLRLLLVFLTSYYGVND